jgi:endo-1,3-1,4-beta-glycanase ExoK
MSIKALSPLFAVSCLSGLALAFAACSDPPAAGDPPGAGGTTAVAGTSTTAGTGTSGSSTATGGTGTAGTATGTAGSGTAGTNPTGGSGGSAAGGMGTGGTGTGGSGTNAPTYPGYTLVIDQGFDAPIDLDKDPVWTWSDGGLSEGQVRYVKDAITFGDGHMKITTSKPAAAIPGGQSFAENGTVGTYQLQSGEFRTKFNNYRYGRYEASIKAPVPVAADMAAGNFINTLFTFRTPKVEEWREIDIEIIGGGVNKVFSNIVYGDGKGSYDQTMHGAAQVTAPANLDTRAMFHTYAFVWKADSVTWYIDGAAMPVRAFPGMPQGDGNPPIPNKSAKIMMSMWVFGGSYAFGGVDGDQNMYPFTAEYDFFRFYKQDGETYPMDPKALPPEDLNKSKNNPTETDTQG